MIAMSTVYSESLKNKQYESRFIGQTKYPEYTDPKNCSLPIYVIFYANFHDFYGTQPAESQISSLDDTLIPEFPS